MYSIAIVGLTALGCFGHYVQADSHSGNWPIKITVQHRPGTYWWCPGSAWDKKNIDWNLEQLKDGGIGTVHIVPIYGAKGYEDRYLPFLSDKWLEMLQYILQKADSLGMQVDMTTGTGWCFGGPDLTRDQWDAMAFLDEKTGKLKINYDRMVKRAAPGGAGHMLNPLSPAAITSYLKRFDPILKDGTLRPRAQYHDSFEYFANWSPELPEEFKKRRGYDITEHIQTLFGSDENQDRASRIKYDYRLTAAEIHREFIQIWSDWARSGGMLTRDQAHGSPANLLDVYATADIPETEMFGSAEFAVPGFRRESRFSRPPDSDLRICRMASSAAHVAHTPGRQLVSAETCTWLREHWHGTLGQIKLQMDLFFLAGINHVFYHGSCYSPQDAPWPGWFFYASTKVDWRNSIWRDIPLLNNYLARCQSVLQAGQPANDILLYWPIHDLWMEPQGLLKNLSVHYNQWMDQQRIGQVAKLLDETGYAYDFISDQMLYQLHCEKGKLKAPGGQYRLIVVPHCKFMPAETLKSLADLAEQGAVIIFEQSLPADVPGWSNFADRRTEFAAAKARLKKVTITTDIDEALSNAQVKREPLVDQGLRYVRRISGADYWYFITNHTAHTFKGPLDLAVPFTSAVLHDPMTGTSVLLPTKTIAHSSRLYLDIAPGQSFIIQASPTELNAPAYVPLQSSKEVLTLDGKWDIEFIDGGPELPKPYSTTSLLSWTNAPDKKAQAFAGTARYKLTFNLPDLDGEEYLLDLGDLRESARVKINGQNAATLFALPLRALVGRYLKKGSNTIEIEVTNLAANRIRDLDLRGVNWKIMHDINIVNQHYKKFNAADWPLQPSGLLGPVKLIRQTRIRNIFAD